MDDDKVLQFDQHGSIRIYDPERFDEAKKTLETEKEYLNRMAQFKQVVAQTMGIVEQLGKAIETEKLRAIGARNVAESEAGTRQRALEQAKLQLQEKQAEMDRIAAELSSLEKVEKEQRTVIQRLSFSSE
jgi:intraflagellar transport protein 20